MDVEVVLRPLHDTRWPAFMAGHPSALPFHHPSWAAMLAECYGFRAFCLTVEDRAGDLLAGLPVIEVRRALVGERQRHPPGPTGEPPDLDHRQTGEQVPRAILDRRVPA